VGGWTNWNAQQFLRQEIEKLRAELGTLSSRRPSGRVAGNRRAARRRTGPDESGSFAKFPIRLRGMALMNLYHNGAHANGRTRPPSPRAPGRSTAGLTFRQTVIGLEYRGPQSLFGARVSGSVFGDFYGNTETTRIRARTAYGGDRLRLDQPHTDVPDRKGPRRPADRIHSPIPAFLHSPR
jgi:hypothetical protein